MPVKMSIIWHKLQQWLRRYTTNVCNEKQQQQQQQQQLLTFISFSNVSKKIKRLTNFKLTPTASLVGQSLS